LETAAKSPIRGVPVPQQSTKTAASPAWNGSSCQKLPFAQLKAVGQKRALSPAVQQAAHLAIIGSEPVGKVVAVMLNMELRPNPYLPLRQLRGLCLPLPISPPVPQQQ